VTITDIRFDCMLKYYTGKNKIDDICNSMVDCYI